jgi:hypothetical protein
MKKWRRYEILLPLQSNDGTPIPRHLIAETLLEIEQRFGAVSCETQVIQGRWRAEGKSFRDDLIRIYIDAEDTAESKEFFLSLKERTKLRFQQLDIWLTSHSIDVL